MAMGELTPTVRRLGFPLLGSGQCHRALAALVGDLPATTTTATTSTTTTSLEGDLQTATASLFHGKQMSSVCLEVAHLVNALVSI
jgi:hypothetical protein